MVITTRLSVFWPAIRNVTILPTPRSGGGDASVRLRGQERNSFETLFAERIALLGRTSHFSGLSIFQNKEEAYGRNV